MSERDLRLEPYLILGRLPCALAFRAAADIGVAPVEVREAADAADIRVSRCQLGLFGFEEFGEKRLDHCATEVPDDLRDALSSAATSDAVSCAVAWRLADSLGVPRVLVGSAANAMGIRVVQCQLGCFT
jgi:hypothetical protein